MGYDTTYMYAAFYDMKHEGPDTVPLLFSSIHYKSSTSGKLLAFVSHLTYTRGMSVHTWLDMHPANFHIEKTVRYCAMLLLLCVRPCSQWCSEFSETSVLLVFGCDF